MRSSRIAFALLLLIASASSVSAHRRDELLQAARIDIAEDRVSIELSLTPGIAVADDVIASIDRDRDAVLSGDEKQAYLDGLLSTIALTVDGEPIAMQATATFPALADLRGGERSIDIHASAPLSPLVAGRHQLTFSNSHRSDISVYLANALKPDGNRGTIVSQHRDPEQRALTIDYAIDGERLATLPVWLFGFGAAAWLVFRRRLLPAIG